MGKGRKRPQKVNKKVEVYRPMRIHSHEDTFTCWPRLPAELKRMVWQTAETLPLTHAFSVRFDEDEEGNYTLHMIEPTSSPKIPQPGLRKEQQKPIGSLGGSYHLPISVMTERYPDWREVVGGMRDVADRKGSIRYTNKNFQWCTKFIDEAKDLVYLKLWGWDQAAAAPRLPPGALSFKRTPQPGGSYPIFEQTADFSALNGVARVAIEIDSSWLWEIVDPGFLTMDRIGSMLVEYMAWFVSHMHDVEQVYLVVSESDIAHGGVCAKHATNVGELEFHANTARWPNRASEDYRLREIDCASLRGAAMPVMSYGFVLDGLRNHDKLSEENPDRQGRVRPHVGLMMTDYAFRDEGAWTKCRCQEVEQAEGLLSELAI